MSISTDRIRISSGAPWEKTAGYCRAIRVGDRIEVAGTTAMREGEIQFPGDAYQQARCIFDIIQTAIVSAGGQMSDVIRTRMYITQVADAEAVTRAHGEVFGVIRPVATLVVVAGLISPELLVEIEASVEVSVSGS